MSILGLIDELLNYAVERNLIEDRDKIWNRNKLLDLFSLQEYKQSEAADVKQGRKLEEILNDMLDYAFSQNIIDSNDVTTRDLFDTKIMGRFMDRPSLVGARFERLYRETPQAATDWFYELSQNNNYIRRERIQRDLRWKVDSQYGQIEISVNKSKPEKDPRAIAAARNVVSSAYPACQLCMENEGYAGRMNHPARQNHVIIPIKVNEQDWGFQYSPYVYYNEHCIVFNSKHVPMKIEKDTFKKMFSFVEQFPHYFVGSNADLPIVGGSILSHDHFQGGRYTFAIERAEYEKTFTIKGFEDVEAGIVKWPMSVIRIRHKESERLIELGSQILDRWRSYSDPEALIYAETKGEPHNTITPIARKRGELFELDLVLRNNLTSPERPMGLYHPRPEYHHIKKENIGLIEVMGLAVLPARLDREMALLQKYMQGDNLDSEDRKAIEAHLNWAEEIMQTYPEAWQRDGKKLRCKITSEELRHIIENEIGKVFVGVLEDAGVYKCDREGREAFMRFVDAI